VQVYLSRLNVRVIVRSSIDECVNQVIAGSAKAVADVDERLKVRSA
jgi:hypothetical protein